MRIDVTAGWRKGNWMAAATSGTWWRAQASVTEDVRELAEDVGDDRAVGQLAAGRRPNEATLVGRFSPRTRVAEGECADVVVDQRALHFFDSQTGQAILSDHNVVC